MSGNILIVDDEEEICHLLKSYLSSQGFNVHVAFSGEQALGKVMEENFDLVITDLKMPKMDGMGLLKRLKTSFPDIAVIILTGYGSLETAIQTLRAGQAYDYLLKPLENLDELSFSVSKALEYRNLVLQNKKLINELQEFNQTLQQKVNERTKELNQALIELKKLDKLKDNFIATISHELRSPLTPIDGYLELLLEKELGDLTPKQEEGLKIMMECAIKLRKMIEEILYMVHLDMENPKKIFKEIDIKAQFEEVISFYAPCAKKKQIEMNMNVPDNMPYLKGELSQINRLLYILVDNALKFSNPSGKVILKVELISNIGGDKNTFIINSQSFEHAKKWAEISVIDQGIGIFFDELSKIFNRFYQVDSSSTKQFSGIGLGLAIAKEIVLTHNSYLKVYSKPKKGSSLSFGLEIM